MDYAMNSSPAADAYLATLLSQTPDYFPETQAIVLPVSLPGLPTLVSPSASGSGGGDGSGLAGIGGLLKGLNLKGLFGGGEAGAAGASSGGGYDAAFGSEGGVSFAPDYASGADIGGGIGGGGSGGATF